MLPGSLLVGECELCSFASGTIFITNLKAVKHLLMENLKKKIYIKLNHFAVHLKLILDYKSTILQ